MMSRTPKLAAVAVLAAFSGLALQVHAQETVELDEVKVTAGRVEQELMDVNMSVTLPATISARGKITSAIFLKVTISVQGILQYSNRNLKSKRILRSERYTR